MAKRMPAAVYQTVFTRAGSDAPYNACEAMIPHVCTGGAEQWHHRKLRKQGGQHEVTNGMGVCAACHRYFHQNPSESYEHGWLVRSHDDPASRLVMRRGVWVELDAEGDFREVKDG